MCSIAGSSKLKEVREMLEVQKHRSPDDVRTVMFPEISIGMGRLSILDLESENLCLRQEGNLTLSYNGEVYNFVEIRQELILKGYSFETYSDTEVLLKAYKHWGVKCLERFNGMFAIAIYDNKAQTVFLARDIAGEKPLYYSLHPFKFASEAKALKFKCIEFPTASYGIYNLRDKKMTIKRYWELKRISVPKTFSARVEKLEELLEDAIKIRTRSDVPYGLYYSEGIDSSLINTFHNFKYKFTYKDRNYKHEFERTFPRILWHLDYPVEHFSPFALWKLAERASEKVKVVISGEGADELFGGYVRYISPHFNWEAQKIFPSYKIMFEPIESVNEAGWREFNENLKILLRMGDRMSSAFGIENRCPFLDKRIIEFAFSIPESDKINKFETKIILKHILLKRNPKYKFIEKTGLFCNVNKWINSGDGYEKKDYLKLQDQIWKGFK